MSTAPTVVIVGGGVAGLVGALALRPLGYQVQVLDREPDAAPESVERANAEWVRSSVPQALHSHAFTSLGIGLLRTCLPEVHAGLLEAGAREINLGATTALRDSPPEPADAELTVLACRRRTFDAVLAATADRLGVAVRHGVVVRGLVLDGADTEPRVTGVRLDDGSTVPADLVIDATGRRAESRQWLAEAGVEVAEDRVVPSDIACYTRFYRSLVDGLPGVLNRGNAGGGIFGHYMAFVHPGDNGTFSVGIGVLPDDPELKAIRDEAAFTAVLAGTPLLAPWIAEGASEPISPVHAIRFPDNTVRGVATPRQRPVAGLFQLGDAACVTNPLYGRGISLAIAHAYQLAETLGKWPQIGPEQSLRVAEATEALLVPWFEQAVNDDLERIRIWRATVHGEQLPPLPEDYVGLGTAAMAGLFDMDILRRMTRVLMSLDQPETFYGDPAMRERVRSTLVGRTLPAIAVPGREELVRAVSEAGR